MNDLTIGNEMKKILLFAFPILLSNIFQQFYNIVDAVMVGRLLGEQELAAVGAAITLQAVILAVALGLTLGLSILVSSYFGSGDSEKVKKAISTGMIVSIVITIFVTVIGVVFSKQLLAMVNVPKDIINLSNIYLVTLFWGMFATFGYNLFTNILRGLGDTKSSLYILIISTLLNVLLDILFIYSFKWGVFGAAFATVLSQVFSLVAIYIYCCKRYPQYRINIFKLSFDKPIFKESMRLGIPAMLQQVFISLGFVVLQRLINGFGMYAIAAYTAASKIDGFATMPAINLGKAMSNFVAQNKGADKPERIKKGLFASLAIGVSVALVTTLIVIIFGKQLMLMFNHNPEVVNIGCKYLMIVGVFYFIFALMQILNGFILGLSKAFIPMIATISSFCLIQVPVAIILSSKIGINGIWIASPIGWMVGMTIRLISAKKEYGILVKKNTKLGKVDIDCGDVRAEI